MKREKLSSRLGFLLLSAGCAIGIGNVWKFPWMAGQNGGAIFVLIYMFFLLVLGVPAMTLEFAMGRASQKSITKMYHVLEKPGHKWHWHGYVAFCRQCDTYDVLLCCNSLDVKILYRHSDGRFFGFISK